MERTNRETEELRGRVERQAAELEELRDSYERAQREAQELRDQLTAAAAALEASRGELEQLRRRAALAESEIEDLRSEVGEAETKVRKVAQQPAGGAQARQLEELGGRLESLESGLHGEIERLAVLEDAAQRIVREAAENASAAAESSVALERRLTELQEELDRKNEELQLSLLEIDRLRSDGPGAGRGGLEARIQDLNMQLGDRDAEIILLNSRLRAQRQWVQKVRAEVNSYRNRATIAPAEARMMLEALASALAELEK